MGSTNLYRSYVSTAEAARTLGLDEEILVGRLNDVFGIVWVDGRGYVPTAKLSVDYVSRLWIRALCGITHIAGSV